ncbi:MAG: acetylglutamate kinase [Thermoplasmata archaeon]|nr:acetylglutamate kinase [Thermoplasmata archaeon]
MTSTTKTPWVVKIGGRELVPGPELDSLVAALATEHRAGRWLVVVHGGGDEVTDRAASLGLTTERHQGRRVTSLPMLEVVTEVLAGRINSRLVAALTKGGVDALGMTGVSQRLVTVTPAGTPKGSLGYVGTPRRVNSAALRTLLATGSVPVVAPLGIDSSGTVRNVNADEMAAAFAGALGAELFLLTDVEGVRGPNGRPVAELSIATARQWIRNSTAKDGMVPKLEGAIAAVEQGAVAIRIGPTALLTGAEGGTRIVADPKIAAAPPSLVSPATPSRKKR